MSHRLFCPTDPASLDRLHAGHAIIAPEIVAGREEEELAVVDILAEAGLGPEAAGEVLDAVEEHARHRAFHLAAQAVAWVGEALTKHSTHSASVAAALGINNLDGQPAAMAVIGARLGATKQAIGNAVAKLSRSFAAAPPPRARRIKRPSLPGRWLSVAEIRTEFDVSAEWVKIVGVPSVEGAYHHQKFYDADKVAAAVAARQIAEAAPRAALAAKDIEYRRRAAAAERAQNTEERSGIPPGTPIDDTPSVTPL